MDRINGLFGIVSVTSSVSADTFADTDGLEALVDTAQGIYGVVSQTASEHAHEYGARIALGAGRKAIAMTVIRDGVILMLSGTSIGQTATVCVVVVMLMAMCVPAHRATKVDPVVPLRTE